MSELPKLLFGLIADTAHDSRMRQRIVLLLVLIIGCNSQATVLDTPAPRASPSGSAHRTGASANATSGSPAGSSVATAEPSVPSYRALIPEREREAPALAKRYANLKGAACAAELSQRKLPVKPWRGKTPGLSAPLRMVGPLHGVEFELPRSVYGLMDCRLALLLDDMARELSRRGVSAVVVNNAYRPNSVLPAKPAKRGGSPMKPAGNPKQLSQHALGLGIDIMAFRLVDGRVLNVEQDWHGTMGEEPCGPKSRVKDEHPAGVELRNLTCAIASTGYCNHLITPNRDEAHANHLHCDIEAGAHEVTVE